jgi:hypothetical protein
MLIAMAVRKAAPKLIVETTRADLATDPGRTRSGLGVLEHDAHRRTSSE